MIEYIKGNILEAKAEAIVNTVNTVGVMGKGIALQFKKAFPENYKSYVEACKRGEVRLGKMFLFPHARLEWPKYIINFPTKRHWKSRSNLQDIKSGLNDLIKLIDELKLQSIAIPPLGCGLGGLPWPEVRVLVESAFANHKHVKVLFYQPAGAPRPEEMPIRTEKPRMTLGRAVLIALMDSYSTPIFQDYVSLLEIQKLTYFQQTAGENLRLAFSKGRFGPYADNLRHVLNILDGHYISGWGDGANKPRTPLTVMPGARDEAYKFLKENEATHNRFKRVARLIDGFETPYGMELLGTVHWVIDKEVTPEADFEDILRNVQAWTKRKKHLFTPDHIKAAEIRLKSHHWI